MQFDRVRGLLVMALAMVAAVAAASALAASPSHGTVSVGHPSKWKFAPVGGPSGTSDTYKLTVKLPRSVSALYAPNVRTGTNYAAVLTIRLSWKSSSPDSALGLSATDKHGKSVGDDTLATTNNGGN